MYCIQTIFAIIIIDSFDGAQHRRTSKERTNIVSFSSQMLTLNSIKAGYSTSASRNILTWQQMIGTESYANLMPVLEPIYERKKEINNNNLRIESDCKFMNKNSKITLYDLHDGKMLYLLTQHSLYNRKFHPFLLCKCQRGEGVINNMNHECKIISHEEQIHYYNRSIKRWKNKRIKRGDTTYNIKKHMDWIDEENYGISHFGIHPDQLRRDKIRFDVFHLRCAITRRLMDYLRKFIIKQSEELKKEFSDMLLTFLTSYNVLVWNYNWTFSSYLGHELLNFIENAETIKDFLITNFVKTKLLEDLCSSLLIWKKINHFQ